MSNSNDTEMLVEEELEQEQVKNSTTVDLAIIIVSYNTAYHLKRCLLSIKKNQLSSGNLAVVVVDNASSDGSCDMVRKKFPWVVLVENSDNLGFAKGCNAGIRAVSAKYYLLLNSDAAIMGNALDVLVNFMDTNPDIGATGGLTYTEDGKIQPSTLVYPSYWNLVFSRASILSKLPVFRWKMSELRRVPDEISDVEALAGNLLILRGKTLDEVGLLDERYFIYLEDIDICKRFRDNNWRVVFNPNARILHTWGATSSKRKAKAFWWHHISMFKYFQKHYPYLLPINLCVGLGLLGHYAAWYCMNVITNWPGYSKDNSKETKR